MIRLAPDLFDNNNSKDKDLRHTLLGSYRTGVVPMLRRKLRCGELRCVLLWTLSILLVVWYLSGLINFEGCGPQGSKLLVENKSLNRPVIFVGGVPRSGTTLMRAMLDAHPDVRCGEETRVIPRIIFMRNQWKMSKRENERLIQAGMSDEILDSAVGAFIMEVILNHGKPVKHLCNKDPLVLRFTSYMKNVFPNSKYILMIRDGRATVHSIITRKVSITGFDLTSYRECLKRWNGLIEQMYAQCIDVGPEACLPVYYEQLVLHPESQMRNILKFLGIEWDDSVLHHEKLIGKEITLSKVERSSDQVIKPVNLDALNSWVGKIPNDVLLEMDTIAPMLRRLGYDPHANPPNYGEPDKHISDNTFHINENREYWKELARKVSVHADKPEPNQMPMPMPMMPMPPMGMSGMGMGMGGMMPPMQMPMPDQM